MAFTKIDEEIILHGGVTPLPDSPQLQPAALKAKFDEKGDAACNGFNNFVDEISNPTTGAINIGVTVPDNITSVANVQALFNTLAVMAVASETDRHTHDNKSILDDIDVAYKAVLDDITTALNGITSVATSNLDPASTTELPTSSAVAGYFASRSTDILNTVYPIGSAVLTKGANPHNLFGFGTWSNEGTVGSLSAWSRTA